MSWTGAALFWAETACERSTWAVGAGSENAAGAAVSCAEVRSCRRCFLAERPAGPGLGCSGQGSPSFCVLSAAAASALALAAAAWALWRAVGEARLGAGSLACGAPSMASRSEATAITGLTAQTSKNHQADRFVEAQ